MTKNTRKAEPALPPDLMPFAMVPRDVMRSDAWRSLGINERRVIDFLLLEHLSKGGRENGSLKAPWLQLVEFGVAKNFITSAIVNLEACGLIGCQRGPRRTMNLYTLNWLPMPDGSMPTMIWRAFRDEALRPLPSPMAAKYVPKEGQAMSLKRDKSRRYVPKEGQTTPIPAPKYVPERGVLSRKHLSNQGEQYSISKGERAAAGGEVVPLPRVAGGGQ